ncbi:GMC family oxidoreductase N-terminal domain-containing protein [Nonomuraea typhae]|uniref:GMC family oxidoreductase N-terminal domain-containing protein n=1 Tax=Nonomuraea typhae TaxID=2603600 RepID=UPI0015E25057|nr:GMC family oxidoreductase [Nonomuraea typhae]
MNVFDRLVPGSAQVGAEEYAARTGRPGLGAALAELSGGDLAALAGTPAFDLVRAVAIEAYYGDYASPGYTGQTGHEAIGFTPPQAVRLRKSWEFLDERPVPYAGDDEADVIVVGSGAGGGLIAAELGRAGLDVLLLEAGELHGAADHTRFELRANHRLWWPARFAEVAGDRPLALLSGRCVGGTTVINTKVALRAPDDELPFALGPYYDRVEAALGVRVRADWPPSVHLVRRGFQALGADLKPVESYTDYTCSRCGSCLQGCPTNAGRNTLNTWLAPALARGEIRLRTGVQADRLLISAGRVTGVAHAGGVARAPVVVLAAGALNTPQILRRTPGFPAFPGTLGLHPARLVYGLFDTPQDCHMVYPITAHCLDFQRDFIVEATTIQDPVAFAASLVDSAGLPLWGRALTEVVRDYRHWAGLLVMANDLNTASVAPGDVFRKSFTALERERMSAGLAFAVRALEAAGAKRVVWTGLCTSHVQGSAPIGGVTDENGRVEAVEGLYVGDASLIPVSLSVNPSLTVMALATRVADAIRERAPG